MSEKILVISTYPPKGSTHNHPFSAVAMYTKNTLLSTSSVGERITFTVLADEFDNLRERYFENDIEVVRCWKRNTPMAFLSIIHQVLKKSDYHKIFFAFEWSMFGKKKWLLSFIPGFLLLMRIWGKKIFFISHGVLLKAEIISPQMGVKEKSFTTGIWTLGLRILYLAAVNLSYKTIVFEEYLRKELLALALKKETVNMIPFGVEEPYKQEKNFDLRRKFNVDENDFLIICFGFLSWYKGSDFLVKAIKEYLSSKPNSKIKLIMVGGPTNTYKSDAVYQKYINGIYKNVEDSRGKIEITGFVDEKEIGPFYKAADLVILPYRVFVSSSGPLSLVFTYKKPFLFSSCLFGYQMSEDFFNSLKEARLKIDDLTFSMDKDDLIQKIEIISKDGKLLKNIAYFSGLMYEKRKWSIVGEKYYNLLKQ